jgi:hypothetical protein
MTRSDEEREVSSPSLLYESQTQKVCGYYADEQRYELPMNYDDPIGKYSGNNAIINNDDDEFLNSGYLDNKRQ